jgi:hypothetical protein
MTRTQSIWRWIARAAARLESATAACFYSLGDATLDGLVAYGMALHGYPFSQAWTRDDDTESRADEAPLIRQGLAAGRREDRATSPRLALVDLIDARRAPHVQIVTFNLKDATEQSYRALCDDLAPKFSSLPGLLTKYWLADPSTNTYGGVYIWTDRVAMETFMSGRLAAAVIAHPSLTAVISKYFGILEAPTRLTRGLLSAA